MLPWFTKYPNQNDEILNLDWVIRQVENLKASYEAFLAANSLTFADPIVWDITKQYSKNTIVLSPEGDAYLSKKAVGAGIQLNNTEYWLEIFNFAEYVRTANSNLTVHIEQNTTRATAAYAIDDWLLWEDVLYKVTATIAVDDLLTVGTNIVHFTVEDFCRAWQTYMVNTIAQYKADIDASELLYKQQLDGTVLQYKNDIDASELAFTNQVQNYVNTTTGNLQAQLDAAIAGVTVDSEVINARVGADGTIYSTLGDAIRTQISALTPIRSCYEITVDMFEKGSWVSGAKSDYNEENRARTITKYIAERDIIINKADYSSPGNIMLTYYNPDMSVDSDGNWNSFHHILAGSIFSIVLSENNTPPITTHTVSEIFAMFTFEYGTSIIDDLDLLKAHYFPATITQYNTYSAINTGRLSSVNYFKCPESIIYVHIPTGFSIYPIGYDEDFTLVDYEMGWSSGDFYLDLSSYAYARFVVNKSGGNIEISDLSDFQITTFLPRNIEYFNSGNIIGIAKDGINTSEKSTAPKYPQSSFVSFKKAFIQGFRAILIHVQFTSDNVPVVYHDLQINSYARNSDGTLIQDDVYVASSTLAELDTYDFGIAFGSQYTGTKITRLDDALKDLKKLGVYVLIEGSDVLTDSQEDVVCGLLRKYHLENNCGYQIYTTDIASRFHTKIDTADLYLWCNNETEINNKKDAFAALKDNNRLFIYTYSETSISESTCVDLSLLGIEVVQQALTGTEPTNITNGITAVPYTSGVVSQIMPVYAIYQNSI